LREPDSLFTEADRMPGILECQRQITALASP